MYSTPAALPCQYPEESHIPRWKAEWQCKSLWIFMSGITARSPAKGLGAFDPGLDPGEECAKGGVRLEELARREKEPKGDTQRSGWCRQGSLFWTGMVYRIP